MTKPTLLVIDDEPMMTSIVGEVGELAGFNVYETNTAKQFQEILSDMTPSIIVMDYIMPQMDGIDLLKWLIEKDCNTAIILMSGYEDILFRVKDKLGSQSKLNIVGVLVKPFKLVELENLLKNNPG